MGNAVEPLVVGAQLGVPVVDADGMGRAFPQLQMISWLVEGAVFCPTVLSDDMGNCISILSTKSAASLESLVRTNVVALGMEAGMVLPPLLLSEIQSACIPNTYSCCWRIGQIIAKAQRNKDDVVSAVTSFLGGKVITRGKIAHVKRWTTNGFVHGYLDILSNKLDAAVAADSIVRVEFQNENLIAREKLQNGQWRVVASVPDLISILDSDTGTPILTEELRFGFRVAAVVSPSPAFWRSSKALATVGPNAFGYKGIQYEPCGPPTPMQSLHA